ncbi:MAG: metal ABC transporter permease, partial [Moraxellaceae bacterium]|nr:metal ABC transporter permease [Moraxellaceae bacterium]
MFDYLPIIASAWIAGSLLALLSAPLGCLVLWRRMAFFSDALAHGTLLGVGLAVLLNFPINIGILLVSLMVVAVLVFLDDKRLPSDALLSVVAVALLCLGLLILTQ